MRNRLTKEECVERFRGFMCELSYVPESGECYIQAREPLPPYWFVGNKGKVISVAGTPRILKPIVRVKDSREKREAQKREGKEPRFDWVYEYEYINDTGTSRKAYIKMHRLVAEYFPNNPFGADFSQAEVHHIQPKRTFSKDQPHLANRADNLQVVSKDDHKLLTDLESGRVERYFAEREETAEPSLEVNPDLKIFICDDRGEEKKVQAYNAEQFLQVQRSGLYPKLNMIGYGALKRD